MKETKKERFLYIDNLRLLMIIFVVIMHSAVTYSGMGSWYYKEPGKLGLFSMLIFGFYQSFTQGYFMGFLFLISGYFVPGAYDKKGFFKFTRDRLIRLGIPTLIYMLVIHPFIIYFILNMNWLKVKPAFGSYYFEYITSLEFIGESGPLWFAFALLIFTIIYALIRLFIKRNRLRNEEEKISVNKIAMLIILISLVAFTIRIVQPIDTSILNMQLCFFSQYIILFIVGIMAYRNNWFTKLEYGFGLKFLKSALIPGAIIWGIIMITGGVLKGESYFKGGLHWQSAAYALWESFTAVSMSVGLIALFKEKYNKQNGFIKLLSDNSFAVYVFHAPILVVISQSMKEIELPPLMKFLMVCILCLAISFTFTNFMVRKIPFLKKIM